MINVIKMKKILILKFGMWCIRQCVLYYMVGMNIIVYLFIYLFIYGYVGWRYVYSYGLMQFVFGFLRMERDIGKRIND